MGDNDVSSVRNELTRPYRSMARVDFPAVEATHWRYDKGVCGAAPFPRLRSACGERVGVRGPLHKGGLAEGERAFPRSSDSWRRSPPPPLPANSHKDHPP